VHQVNSVGAARQRRRLLSSSLVVGAAVILAGLGSVPEIASAATTSWSIAPAPTFSAPQGTLTAVSCPSASSCIAVGYYIAATGTKDTFAETWNGSIWTLDPTPARSSAAASELTSVSCSSAGACTAVGYSCSASDAPSCPSTAGTEQMLLERWNGKAWAMESTPTPTGAIDPVLTGVSCPTANSCTAVGSYEVSGSDQYTLAYRWNGSTWSRVPTPNRPTVGSRSVSYFSGVSCTTASFCLAVGVSAYLSLAEFWNGTKWLVSKTPNPPAGADEALSAVSCSSSSSCMAVGIYTASGDGGYPVADYWNGKTWIDTAPGDLDSNYITLSGVSCTSSKSCIEVGIESTTSPTRTNGFAAGWNGTNWDGELGKPSQFPDFNGISCATASSCMLVGANENADGQTVAGAQLWNGKSWLLENPSDPQAIEPGSVAALSCASPTFCAAVGTRQFVVGGTTSIPVGATWNGSSWVIDPMSEPGGTAAGGLSAVSCASPTACVAVGQGGPGNGAQAAAWNGEGWSLAPMPDPPGTSQFLVDGISCPAASQCVAVGESLPAETPLVEVWDGTIWTAETAATTPANTDAELVSVACTAQNSCIAVGGFFHYSPHETSGLVETWNGTDWTIPAVPSTPLSSVSCPSASQCVAVGPVEEQNGDTGSQAFGWNGSTWTAESVATPSGAVTSSLASVSCASATDCTAVGYYETNAIVTGPDFLWVETWNGAAWTAQPVPSPARAAGSLLGAVSCSSSTYCVATGQSVSSEQVQVPLVETGP
jgi:hypothetical protein